jgi:hypothetical protein
MAKKYKAKNEFELEGFGTVIEGEPIAVLNAEEAETLVAQGKIEEVA